MAVIPKFEGANLQALADILGATDTGLTGSEIGRYLRECFSDPLPQMTKRHRLYPRAAEHKSQQGSDGWVSWEIQAKTSLFRAKRSE